MFIVCEVYTECTPHTSTQPGTRSSTSPRGPIQPGTHLFRRGGRYTPAMQKTTRGGLIPPSVRSCNELSFADSRLKRPSEDSLPFQVKKTRRAWVGWRTLESSTELQSVKRLSWGQVCAPKGMLSLRSSGDEGAHLQGPADLIASCQTASAQLPDLIAQGPIFFGKFILVRRLGSPAAQMKDTWQPRAERVGKPAGGGEGAGWRSAGIGEGRRAGGRGLCKGRG